MKLNKYILIFLVVVLLGTETFAREKININFGSLNIYDFIKITSKIINKNILITENIPGKVNFISNKAVYKDEIYGILLFALESKGFTVVENKGILRIVKLNDASKYNMPVYNNEDNLSVQQVMTEVFKIENVNVDYVSSKVRHLISKSAKLVTDKESNTIILTDFLENINTVKKVIALITKDAEKTIEIVSLKNLQATTIVNDLKAVSKTIFNEKVLKEKVEVLLNKDTNSIMYVGKKENVEYMKKYLLNMEIQGSLVEKVVEVIHLKNAESKVIINTISNIIGNKKYQDESNKPFASTDEETNAIILMGPKEEIKYFKELITKLDIDRQQVYVQARIIEVSETRTRDVGIKYGLSGFNAGGGGLTSFSSALNGGNDVTPVDLTSLSGYGYDLSTMKSGMSLGMSLNLLNQNGAADIVSEPSLLCINNKESSIYVGQTISIKTGTTTTSGGIPTDTYTREDVGLTLKVKPRISNGGKVLLEITTKLEDVGQTATNSNPNTSKKELLTSAIVNNGENIILGGYIRAKKENTEDKVAFFGDIPLIGSLFRNNREVNDKINLVIIITPYIVPKSKDLTYVRNQLAQLKLLEDKYTKDTMLRLEKLKLKSKQEDLLRAEDRLQVNDGISEINEEYNELKEDTKDDLSNKDEEMTQEQRDHEQRVKEILGL